MSVIIFSHLYFSGVTLLSVGYGDLVPVGSARFFALIQAAIGFLLPTAFFIRALGEKGDNDGEGAKPQKRDKGTKAINGAKTNAIISRRMRQITEHCSL